MMSGFKAPAAAVLAVFLYATSAPGARAVSAQVIPSRGTSDTLRLTLRGAAALAAERNPAVVAARARISQAEARVLESKSAFLPHISAYAADGAHTMNTATFGIEFPTPAGQDPIFDPNGEVIGPIHIVDLRTRLTQSIYDYGNVERSRGARAAVKASDADAFAIAAEVASGAAAAYVRTLRAQSRMNARQADIRLSEDLVGIAQNSLSAGVGVALDVTRARARLAMLQAQLISDRNEVAHARLALSDALGTPPEQPIVLTDSLGAAAAAEGVTDEAAVAVAVAQRRDLQAFDARLHAAALSARAIRAERYPSLQLAGDEGFIGKSWNHLLNTYTVNLQVSVPVFQGFALRARQQEQSAVMRELEARREDLRRLIERQVRDALLDQRSAQEQVAAARASVDLAEQLVQQARERVTAGVAGNSDLVEASLVLSSARSVYIDALAGSAIADVALARAQGLAGTR